MIAMIGPPVLERAMIIMIIIYYEATRSQRP